MNVVSLACAVRIYVSAICVTRAECPLTMGAPELAATSSAAVVEVADDAEGDRWKAMADAFDFGGLSDDDGDGSSGDDRGDLSHVRPNLTPSTPQPSD